MTGQLWWTLVGTVLGGIIALASSVVTTLLTKRIDRKEKRELLRLEAYSDWTRCLEELLSHHSNYYDLIALEARIEQGKEVETWKQEVMRVSTKTGDSGRRFDAAYYRLLLLETRAAFRGEVVQITEASKLKELAGVGSEALSAPVRTRANELRERVTRLLQDLARAEQ